MSKINLCQIRIVITESYTTQIQVEDEEDEKLSIQLKQTELLSLFNSKTVTKNNCQGILKEALKDVFSNENDIRHFPFESEDGKEVKMNTDEIVIKYFVFLFNKIKQKYFVEKVHWEIPLGKANKSNKMKELNELKERKGSSLSQHSSHSDN